MFAAEGWDGTTKAGTEGNAMENAALGSDRQRPAAGKRPRVNWSRWATWTAGFIAFPIAGLAGRGVIGNTGPGGLLVLVGPGNIRELAAELLAPFGVQRFNPGDASQ